MFPPLSDTKLTDPAATSRVKLGALAAFRIVRIVQISARSVPGVLQTAGRDIAEAWRETARPNV